MTKDDWQERFERHEDRGKNVEAWVWRIFYVVLAIGLVTLVLTILLIMWLVTNVDLLPSVVNILA